MHYYDSGIGRQGISFADFDDEAELRAALRDMSDLDALALARRDEFGQTEWVAIERFVESWHPGLRTLAGAASEIPHRPLVPTQGDAPWGCVLKEGVRGWDRAVAHSHARPSSPATFHTNRLS